MDDARNIAQYREENVDTQVGAHTSFEENTDWRKEDREDDFADVAVKMRYIQPQLSSLC